MSSSVVGRDRRLRPCVLPARASLDSAAASPGCLLITNSMASPTSARLWGTMLVAMPTAIPAVPFTIRLGKRGGEDDRFGVLAVVGGAEVDGVLVEFARPCPWPHR